MKMPKCGSASSFIDCHIPWIQYTIYYSFTDVKDIFSHHYWLPMVACCGYFYQQFCGVRECI